MDTYLVAYDYGMGGLWAYVRASSRGEIAERFPELDIVDEPPPWFDAEYEAKLRRRTEDIDSPLADGLLQSIIVDREQYPE